MSWLDEMLKKRNEIKEKEKEREKEKENELRKKYIDDYKKSDDFKKDVVEIVANEWHRENDDKDGSESNDGEKEVTIDDKKYPKKKTPIKTIEEAKKTMKEKVWKNGK